MRKLSLAIAAGAVFAITPVLACPMHQATAQTTGSTATASPMMCAMPSTAAQVQQPGQTWTCIEQDTAGECLMRWLEAL
jgi:hypothetical protein